MKPVTDPPISLGGPSPQPPLPPVIVEVNFAPTTIDSPLLDYIKRSLRASGAPPRKTITVSDEPRWVIVKGTPDSDTIDAVYGTYTEEQADWLLEEFANTSYSRWTKIQLSAAPE